MNSATQETSLLSMYNAALHDAKTVVRFGSSDELSELIYLVKAAAKLAAKDTPAPILEAVADMITARKMELCRRYGFKFRTADENMRRLGL